MKGGRAIVMLANGESKNRFPAFNFLRSQIINELKWGKEINETNSLLDSRFISEMSGSYLDFLYGDFGEVVSITSENGDLYIKSQILELLTGSNRNKMHHIGNYVFKIEEYPNYVAFEQENGEIKSIKIYRDRNEEEASKWIIPIEELKTVKVKLLDAFSNLSFEEAKKQYKSIQNEEKDYDFSNSLIELGVTFYSRTELEKTLLIFEFNAEENPDSPDSYEALAEINERIGNIKEAIKYYRELLTRTEETESINAIKSKIQKLNDTNK
jgi:tetratricopeptide (TPR) repeat protein